MATQSVNSLKKKLDKVYSRYIRLRDADYRGYNTCITCGIVKPWKELQCGHFMSRRFNSTRFDEDNTWPQCYACNVMRNGEQFKYGQELNRRLGDGAAEKLQEKSQEYKSFTIQELLELIIYYNEKIKQYE